MIVELIGGPLDGRTCDIGNAPTRHIGFPQWRGRVGGDLVFVSHVYTRSDDRSLCYEYEGEASD